MEPLLKKIEEKELEKLVPDIPELEEYIKSLNIPVIPFVIINNQKAIKANEKEKIKGRSTSRSKERKSSKEKPKGKNLNKSMSPKNSEIINQLICSYCITFGSITPNIMKTG